MEAEGTRRLVRDWLLLSAYCLLPHGRRKALFLLDLGGWVLYSLRTVVLCSGDRARARLARDALGHVLTSGRGANVLPASWGRASRHERK